MGSPAVKRLVWCCLDVVFPFLLTRLLAWLRRYDANRKIQIRLRKTLEKLHTLPLVQEENNIDINLQLTGYGTLKD